MALHLRCKLSSLAWRSKGENRSWTTPRARPPQGSNRLASPRSTRIDSLSFSRKEQHGSCQGPRLNVAILENETANLIGGWANLGTIRARGGSVFWLIDRKRESLELLKDFAGFIPEAEMLSAMNKGRLTITKA
jgi:hypothetical protein